MSKFYLGPRSLLRLRGVHPDLAAVVKYAISMQDNVDFTVVCGLRTLERQKVLFARGASHTMDSRHIYGLAVDLAPLFDGEISWAVMAFPRLMNMVKWAAHELDVAIECGIDFNHGGTTGTRWVDPPHVQLPKRFYPNGDTVSRSEKAHLFLSGNL